MKKTIQPCLIALFLSAAFCLVTAPVTGQFQATAKCLCSEGDPGSITLAGPSESDEGYSGPFEFNWSGPESFTADTKDIDNLLLPGTYSVTITNQFGCELILDTEIQICEGIYFLNFETQPACLDEASGAIDLTVVGGTGPYCKS